MSNQPFATFDPFDKEHQLKQASVDWQTALPEEAMEGDIPIIDLAPYFQSGSDALLLRTAQQVRDACEQTGFFMITGHQVPSGQLAHLFSMVRAFHALPAADKQCLAMDKPDWPVGGVGYLPLNHRKLPARDKGNLNEAFIVKRVGQTGMEDNQWPAENRLPGFRAAVEGYANSLEALGRRLLPLFATALEMPATYFDEAFLEPTYRLRMTHYPTVEGKPEDAFGIAPHVDTTFCTILAQDGEGLTLYSERRKRWIKAPVINNAFVVNSGELLRHWTNDRFLSVKHFANNNTGSASRYAIPFFFNANAHYKMQPIPSCFSDTNPMKYPTISYSESQAVAQGE